MSSTPKPSPAMPSLSPKSDARRRGAPWQGDFAIGPRTYHPGSSVRSRSSASVDPEIRGGPSGPDERELRARAVPVAAPREVLEPGTVGVDREDLLGTGAELVLVGRASPGEEELL